MSSTVPEKSRLQGSSVTLLKERGYINGQWVSAATRATFEVRSPHSGELLAQVPNMGKADTEQAVHAANEALHSWRRTTAKSRSNILRRLFDLMIERQEELASLITAEQGKPLSEARAEIAYAASFVEWFSEEAKRMYGDTIPHPNSDSRIIVLKQPIGVCAAITPWNFPSAMITRKVAPALAAGCTIVVKPAEQTPLSALALCELADQAGVPPGVLNVVTGDARSAPSIGEVFTSSATVRKLTFTGSTAVGRTLMRQCAGTIKKMSLELGGNAPLIVFDDADVEVAVRGAVAAKFRNAGQACIAANRLYVQDGIYDAFIEHFLRQVQKLQVGDGRLPHVTQGPLIDEVAVRKVEEHIRDAVDKGASVLLGGARHKSAGTYFEPTVLGNVSSDSKMVQEETFGPIAGVVRFKTEAEVIQLANDSEYGLAAYLFSQNNARIWRVSEALESGMIGVNTGIISNESAPFGGVKQSGIGREGSKYGLEEFLEIKYVCISGLAPSA